MMKPEIKENCSCPETCCPSSKKSDDDIKNLLRVCYTEWIIMGVLSMMIMMKMETYLDDDEWMWYMIYSTMLFFFSLPFTVGFHDHITPRCNCHANESIIPSPLPIITSRPSKKEPEFGLIKKVEDALDFGASRAEAEESESSSSSSSFVEKLKRKSKAKKRNRKTKSKKKSKPTKRNVEKSTKKKLISVSTLSKSSSESESSSSSTKVSLMKPEIGIIEVDSFGFAVIKKNNDESSPEELGEELPVVLVKNEEPKPTTVVIKEEIFKGSDTENEERTVEAKLVIKKEPSLHGEAVNGNFEYNLIVDVDPDEDDNMIVDVQGQVEGGEMNVSTHAATQGEGQAEVEAEIKYGDKKDKGEVEIVVSSDAGSSGDEMTLKADKKKKTRE